MRNGCAWNTQPVFPGFEHATLPRHGYRVGLAGKVRQLQSDFPFEHVAGFDANCVRSPTRTHQLDAVNEFMRRDKKQPFCLVVALVEPHVPWVMGDASTCQQRASNCRPTFMTPN